MIMFRHEYCVLDCRDDRVVATAGKAGYNAIRVAIFSLKFALQEARGSFEEKNIRIIL